MNHITWLMVAKLKNIFLVAYFSTEQFLKDIKKYDKNIPIYINSNLAGGVKGEDAAKTILLTHGVGKIPVTCGRDEIVYEDSNLGACFRVFDKASKTSA